MNEEDEYPYWREVPPEAAEALRLQYDPERAHELARERYEAAKQIQLTLFPKGQW